MNLRDLDAAFRELERRADAVVDQEEMVAGSRTADAHWIRSSEPKRRGSLVAAAAASVAVVAAVTAGVAIASNHDSKHLSSSADRTPGPPDATDASSSSIPPTSGARSAGSSTDVPRTEAALTARFRSILGSTATITVDRAHSSKNLITGILTSNSGRRGMYVLEIDRTSFICGAEAKTGQSPTALPCPGVSTLPDGSRLKTDPDFPDGPTDGLMNDAILSRPDGWLISLYTSNVAGKYVGAPVLGTRPALTVNEVVRVVTSPEWLAN